MNKLIIVEGPQGVGKTSITNWIRENLTYSNLYRLTGHNDKSLEGLDKSVKMYDGLMHYIEGLQGCGINLIFDRIFISEEVYCNIGYRQYNFTDYFESYIKRLSVLDFEVIIVNLTCKDEDELSKRLLRDKKSHLDINFCVEESLKQQLKYLEAINYIKSFPSIIVENIETSDSETWKQQLTTILIK